MKLSRAIWALRNVILFVLTASLVVFTYGGYSASIAVQPAQLIANDPGSTINIRQAPSVQADAWYFGRVGDRAQIVNQTRGGDGFTWYKVTISETGVTGWVRGDFVRPLAKASQIKVNPPAIARSPQLDQPSLNSAPAPQVIPTPAPINFPQTSCAPVYPISNPRVNFDYGQTPDPFNPSQTRWHYGIDFDGRIGDTIFSPVCGTVIFAGRETNATKYDWGYGWHVKIQDNEGRIHLLAHVSRIYVKKGMVLTAGKHVADVGNNGNSTGPHLHYEIRQGGDTYQQAINPNTFLAQARLNRSQTGMVGGGSYTNP